MKPLELELDNIGPYSPSVRVDFTKLERLFLICGPTGAGKTTLFDAMTYALYGSALGTRERLTTQLVSHHAPPGAIPQVRLLFSVGTERWRVHRSPPFLRQRQRGEGFVEDSGAVKLEQETQTGWTEWMGLPSAIDEHLRHLVGLSPRDFSKIVVLPQGEFQRFLEAPSRERQDMLEKLFPVEDYDLLTEALKARATAINKERDILERQHQELESALVTLGTDRAGLEQQDQAARERVIETARQWDLVLGAREVRRRRKEVIEALTQVRRQFQELEDRRSEIDPIRAALKAAEVAQGLEADYRRQKEILSEGTALRSQIDELEAEIIPWQQRRETVNSWPTGEHDELAVEAARVSWDEAKTLLAADQLIVRSQRLLEDSATRAQEAASLLLSWGAQLDKSFREAQRELSFWADMAHSLADSERALGLEPGKPCPVCGSPDHPSPAQKKVTTDQPIEEVLRRRTLAQNQLATCQNLRERWMEASAEVRAAAVEVTVAEPRGTPDLAIRGWTEALRDWTSAKENRQLLGPDPKVDRTRDVAAAEQEWLRCRSLAKQRSGERQAVSEALARLDSALASLRQRREASLLAYATVKTKVEAGLTDRGWTYEQLKSSLLSEAERQRMRSVVSLYDEDDLRVQGQLRARESDHDKLGAEVIDPSALETEAFETRIDADRAQALANQARSEHALSEWDRLEVVYRNVSAQRSQLAAQANTVIPVAQAFDGSNARNLKFKTWALVQYLQDVTTAANSRLQVLSGGRYRLVVQTQGTDARTRWGLDLGILDSQTGQERPVGTLSGGEKFMTSISLALGLADVIQARAGGIRLEALFIDEGFGSLDDQTLDRAMAVLHELGQNRTVGLISHVSELRTRIRSQIEVLKGPRGSLLTIHGEANQAGSS